MNDSGQDDGGLEAPEQSSGSSTSPEPLNSTLSCEMCQNYEINLTSLQENDRKLRKELDTKKMTAERYLAELKDERSYRNEMEKKMAELATHAEDQIREATQRNLSQEASIEKLGLEYKKSLDDLQTKMGELAAESKRMEDDYAELSHKYKNLLGLNRKTATELRAEAIDLPTDPDQLMFLCLKLREELIEVTSGKEHCEAELSDQVTLLQEQLKEEQRLREHIEQNLTMQLNQTQTELGIANSKLAAAGNLVSNAEEHARQIRELQHTVAELEGQVAQVQNERTAVEKTAQNYKTRCSTLQYELDTSEAVQKDFVKLSQSLQIQLEKIRQSEQEVRWQWEEEHDQCNGCEASIAKMKPKGRCLHCCKLFCANCVRQSVPSGHNRRPAPVCQVCHTLLNRDSKPFFAQDAPL